MNKVSSVMSMPKVTLNTGMSLAEARDELLRKNVSGAPVVDKSGRLVGVFSQQDLLRVLFAEDLIDSLAEDFFSFIDPRSEKDDWLEIAKSLSEKSVGDVISRNLFTVTPNDTAAFAAETMRKHNIHRLIVIDQGKVVGIVSTFDLLQLVQ